MTVSRRSFFSFLAGAPVAIAAGKVALADQFATGGYVRAAAPMLMGESIVETILPRSFVNHMPTKDQVRAWGDMVDPQPITITVNSISFDEAYPPEFYDHDKINPPGSDTMDMAEFEAGAERQCLSQVANQPV